MHRRASTPLSDPRSTFLNSQSSIARVRFRRNLPALNVNYKPSEKLCTYHSCVAKQPCSLTLYHFISIPSSPVLCSVNPSDGIVAPGHIGYHISDSTHSLSTLLIPSPKGQEGTNKQSRWTAASRSLITPPIPIRRSRSAHPTGDSCDNQVTQAYWVFGMFVLHVLARWIQMLTRPS